MARNMARKTLAASFALAAGLAVSVALPGVAAASAGTKDVTAVLFEWKFDSVAKECTNTLTGRLRLRPGLATRRAHTGLASGGPRTSP